jgi:hypothetical protein
MCQKDPDYYLILTKAVDESFPLNDQGSRWAKEQIPTVIALKGKDKNILNPEGDSYPKTTNLKGLSWNEAQLLWGNPTSGADDTKTFDLVLLTGILGTREGYHLDAKFAQGFLVAYRVRGPLVTDESWKTVK